MSAINSVYYTVKPLIPWRLRTVLRQWRALYLRRARGDSWPIDPEAALKPPHWPGWPDGRQFAVVLTHDVEGPKGLGRVEEVMKLEMQYGFRSSFNFVPAGYRVPGELRRRLTQAGFEVGVHGLEHDGKLYRSKLSFGAKALRIRDYLQRWESCGFRSPLMHHRLDWLHLLGVEYDASTFDTDPFEPQPDGAGTIFPFWVPGPSGTGYVELPYTLVQDFTLFTILREKTIGIWKTKLDWIAEHGGMALLNTHPDYMCFDRPRQRDEYAFAHYESLLAYIRDKYDGTFWHALPRDVSRYYTAALPRDQRNSRKKVCMVAYSYYARDNRVRRYAEALAARGDQVDVIALGNESIPLGEQRLAGVRVFNIQKRKNDEDRKWQYAFRLVKFLWRSSAALARLHKRYRYDVIHVHNVPDFLVFAAWLPRWDGAKVILDIHDVVPELFANKFGGGMSNAYVRALMHIEKISAAFADQVIVSNHLWRERLIRRSVPERKCSAFVNQADPAIFYHRFRTRRDDKFIILFPGTFQWHQGLDIAIEAFGKIRDRVPNAEIHLYGDGGGRKQEAGLREMVHDLALNERVRFFKSVPLEQIAQVIANADLGIVPKRADSFGNEAYSTKIMEFMSQGVPVLVSRTKIDSFYFDDSQVRFFPSGDSRAMADAMLELIQNEGARTALASAGLEYVKQNGWRQKKQEYLDLIDTISTEFFGAPPAARALAATGALCRTRAACRRDNP